MCNILVSGERGFLLSSCLNYLNGIIISYELGNQYNNIDVVIHFASPNDKYEFQDKKGMFDTMVEYSINILKQAINNDAKFVFASSKAADNPNDEYGIYKRFFEYYIQSITNNYLIYRIPRIYGVERNKGLMKQLRLGDIDKKDFKKEICYLDIQDFKKWFLDNYNKIGTIKYNGIYRKNTIQEIKEIYIK